MAELPGGPRGYQVLAAAGRDLPCSQQALGQRVGIDRSVMTYLVDDLEQEGLVERRANPTDRRQRMVVATDKGRELVETACRRVVEAQDELLGTLDGPERTAFRQLLNKAAAGTGEDVDDPCEVADEA